MNEPTPISCPVCGADWLPGTASGCPRCLMQAALEPTQPAPAIDAAPPDLAVVQAAFPQLEILELTGQGGMGWVYKARQARLNRLVALKLLPASLADRDPAFAGRFEREGQLLARLHHPNIVAVHDSGTAGGFFYLLMEFVEGANLRQAMRAGRFTPAQALAIVPKICDALQFAHDEGVLHRDIKPENILLDTRGRVKLVDFGIAKLIGEPADQPDRPDGPNRPHLTQSGTTLGTPSYMAPEQRDTPATVDHRADIYSLGVVFYELLTGDLPRAPLAPPSTKSEADPRVDAIVQQALENDRTRRQHSAGEMRTQVETLASSPPPVPPPPPPPTPAPAAPAEAEPAAWRPVATLVAGCLLSLISGAEGRIKENTFLLAMLCFIGAGWLGWKLRRHPVGRACVIAAFTLPLTLFPLLSLMGSNRRYFWVIPVCCIALSCQFGWIMRWVRDAFWWSAAAVGLPLAGLLLKIVENAGSTAGSASRSVSRLPFSLHSFLGLGLLVVGVMVVLTGLVVLGLILRSLSRSLPQENPASPNPANGGGPVSPNFELAIHWFLGGAFLFVLGSVIPKFHRIFQDMLSDGPALPTVTRWLVGMSEHFPLCLVVVLLASIADFFVCRSLARKGKTALWVWNVVVLLAAAGTATVFAAALHGPMKQIIQMSEGAASIRQSAEERVDFLTKLPASLQNVESWSHTLKYIKPAVVEAWAATPMASAVGAGSDVELSITENQISLRGSRDKVRRLTTLVKTMDFPGQDRADPNWENKYIEHLGSPQWDVNRLITDLTLGIKSPADQFSINFCAKVSKTGIKFSQISAAASRHVWDIENAEYRFSQADPDPAKSAANSKSRATVLVPCLDDKGKILQLDLLPSDFSVFTVRKCDDISGWLLDEARLAPARPPSARSPAGDLELVAVFWNDQWLKHGESALFQPNGERLINPFVVDQLKRYIYYSDTPLVSFVFMGRDLDSESFITLSAFDELMVRVGKTAATPFSVAGRCSASGVMWAMPSGEVREMLGIKRLTLSYAAGEFGDFCEVPCPLAAPANAGPWHIDKIENFREKQTSISLAQVGAFPAKSCMDIRALMKDGTEIPFTRESSMKSGGTETIWTSLKMPEIKAFRIGSRPMRQQTWKDIVVPTRF